VRAIIAPAKSVEADPTNRGRIVGNSSLIALRQSFPSERSRFAADAIACSEQATSEI
jgi:hypothetical protein